MPDTRDWCPKCRHYHDRPVCAGNHFPLVDDALVARMVKAAGGMPHGGNRACRENVRELLLELSGATGLKTHTMRMEVDGESEIQVISMVLGEFAGHARMYRWEHPNETTRWVLTDMWVAEKHRRKGIGSALVRTAVEYGERAGWPEVWLWVMKTNRGAIDLYQLFGFMSRGPWSEYPGYDLMARKLR